MQITIQHILKFRNILNFIYHYIVLLFISQLRVDIIKQRIGVTEFTITPILQINCYYVIGLYALHFKPIGIKLGQ